QLLHAAQACQAGDLPAASLAVGLGGRGQGPGGPGDPAEVADRGQEHGAVVTAAEGGGDLVQGGDGGRQRAAGGQVQGDGQPCGEGGERQQRGEPGGDLGAAAAAVTGHGWPCAPVMPWVRLAVAVSVADRAGIPRMLVKTAGSVTVTVTW